MARKKLNDQGKLAKSYFKNHTAFLDAKVNSLSLISSYFSKFEIPAIALLSVSTDKILICSKDLNELGSITVEDYSHEVLFNALEILGINCYE